MEINNQHEENNVIEDDKEIPIDNLPDFPIYAVNHSRRVYNSGDYVDNGVAKEHLEEHIKYNKTMRFGTALFINGVCVNLGYLGRESCSKIEKEIRDSNIQISQTKGLYQ